MTERYDWEYRKLGDFTYHILQQSQIKPFLMKHLKREWETDHAEFPDQKSTIEWLALLPKMEFTLEILELGDIRLRQDVMDYRTDTYDFKASLRQRANVREESFIRGVSTEPLVVNGDGMELMDGYTRYIVLRDHRQEKVYAYVGQVK